MRTTQLVRAFFLIVLGSLGTTSALAQSTVAPVVAQCDGTHEASAVKNGRKIIDLAVVGGAATNKAFTIEKTSIVAATKSSNASEAINTSANSEASVANASGEASQTSLLEEHKLNVKVQYDARPVGGILTVRVSMTPTFRGIGVSTRPAASRSIALAVDELTQDAVDKLVNELTEEIQAEFKAMNGSDASHKQAQVN